MAFLRRFIRESEERTGRIAAAKGGRGGWKGGRRWGGKGASAGGGSWLGCMGAVVVRDFGLALHVDQE